MLQGGDHRWGGALGPLEFRVLAQSQDTEGRLTVFLYDLPAGFAGPPWHVHADLDEAFYVLQGGMHVGVGDDRHELAAGDYVWLPREVPHGFAGGDEPARFLGLVTPSGQLESMFEDMLAYASTLASLDELDPERMDEINRRHGVEVLGPPLGVSLGTG